MYRSWAYILMVAATLVGVVALMWPAPTVQTIEEIAMPERAPAPRAEAPPKAPKSPPKGPAAKPAPKAAPPAPAAVAKKMPPVNTTTRRAAGAAQPQNGMQPNIFGRPVDEGAPAAPPDTPPKPGITARPVITPKAAEKAAK